MTASPPCSPAANATAAHAAAVWRVLLSGLVVLVLLASCSQGRRERGLDDDMRAYGSLIRWGDIEAAMQYIDPKVLEARPITGIDLERYKQVRIAGYRESGRVVNEDGTATQLVEIEFINIHTQSTNSVIDRQRWRFDDQAKRWWLVSGLPDLTAGRR